MRKKGIQVLKISDPLDLGFISLFVGRFKDVEHVEFAAIFEIGRMVVEGGISR